MLALVNKFLANRFLRFILLGGVAAGVNFLSRFAWSHVMPFTYAVPAAYITGMIVAFLLFRTFVFPQSPTPMHKQVTGFVLVNIFGIIQVWLVSLALASYLLPRLGFSIIWSQAIGHGIAILVPVFSSYLGHKHLSFKGFNTTQGK